MKYKYTIAGTTFDIFNHLLLALITLVTVYPLIHIAMASFSNGFRLMAHQGLIFWPLGFDLAAYQAVFRNRLIWTGYRNTLFMVGVGTALNVILTAMGAYVASRKNVYWQKLFMFMIVFTMFFQGGMIPLFLQVRALGLYNSLWSLILAFAVSAFNLIIMRTYFQGIPDSLEESAKIDGANDFVILFRIIMPVAKPVVATMVLFYGVSRWNGYFWAMVFIRSRGLYPLALVLREILVMGSVSDMMGGAITASDSEQIADSIKYATAMVATIPILCVYPFLQKYFVKGVMIGSLKG
ncbi:MAG: carbohydrate ABC transporter permease [Spirochaetaceae bacterium]|nr:MAG: carbohydrate ABC transporter permease [Spirochaetaceae bacterium]